MRWSRWLNRVCHHNGDKHFEGGGFSGVLGEGWRRRVVWVEVAEASCGGKWRRECGLAGSEVSGGILGVARWDLSCRSLEPCLLIVRLI